MLHMPILMRLIVTIILCCTILFEASANEAVDSLCERDTNVTLYRFNWKQLVVPAALITAASFGAGSDWMDYQNSEIRDELQEHIHRKLGVDDFMQFAPSVGYFGLELCGVRGMNNYKAKTVIFCTASALMAICVYPTKSIINIKRPDGSTSNSFPSGHTAMAFMGAELLRREYRGNMWVGIGGYTMAALTGFLRMYNNRHWLTDVIGGAGIGILSAEAAYWLYPIISKTFFRKAYNSNTCISPSIGNKSIQLNASIFF